MECFILSFFKEKRKGEELEWKEKSREMEEGSAEFEVHQRDLPHGLIANDILTRVPIKSLLRFKCVSKQWYSTLSSYQFAQIYSKLSVYANPPSLTQHLFIQDGNTYYLLSYDDDDDDIGSPTFDINKNLFKLRINFHDILDEKLVFIGSCNGLVCLASSTCYYFILWNPITGKFQKFLDVELSIDFSSPFLFSWGFGYVSSVDDFKVVRVLELPATLEIRVDVFSLKSNKWTRVADELHQDIFSLRSTVGRFWFCCDHNNDARWFPFTFDSHRGVLVNETMYWIVSKVDSIGRKIVSFDLVSEVFHANVDLDLVSSEVYRDQSICNMGGYLCKFGCNMRDDVYIEMLKDSGQAESIRLFRDLHLSGCKDLVGFTRTGKFFIQLRDLEVGLVDRSSTPKYTRLVKFGSLGSRSARTCYIANFVPSLTYLTILKSCQETITQAS